MAPVQDNDSGMESESQSQEISQSQDLVQEEEDIPKTTEAIEDFEDIPSEKPETLSEFDDEPDETLTERLWGLTEMFPESMRNATYTTYSCTQVGIKNLYGFSRNALWIVFSTSLILFAPVIFEVERAQMEELQRNQQKQMLLGPNTAVSGGMAPLMPPMQR